MPYTTLISVPQLAGMLLDPALVAMDCRFSLAALPEGGPDAGHRQYRHGHIPGARYAHLEDDLSDMRDMVEGDVRFSEHFGMEI